MKHFKNIFLYIVSFSILIYPFFTTIPAEALPHIGNIVYGTGTISTSPGRMTIKQTSSNLKINWGSFNIGSGQKVTFVQPSSSAIAINTVTSANPSYIYGALSANGIVFLVNPYGITIGPGGMVNTGGFLAAAENMSQKGSGSYVFSGTGAVSNSGNITVGQNGNVTLVGTTVNNSGSIVSQQGTVSIGASNSVEVDFTSTNQVLLNVSPNTVASAINDSGTIQNNGGTIQLDAGASNALAQSAVNVSGMVMAETTDSKPGSISINSSLTNGTTTLEPTAIIDASAPTGGNGGNISINGYKVVLSELNQINITSKYGENGNIKIDPVITDIGTASALEALDQSQSTYLNNSNVCISITSNINMANGSSLYAWTPLGNGSSSSNYFLGTFNGNNHLISGYTIGTATTPYANKYSGLIGYLGTGGTIKNIGVSGTIYANACYVGGIVGFNTGKVEYSYNNGNITGSESYYSGYGGIAGVNYGGTVEYSYNTGNISGASFMGGIVGENASGTIKNSFNSGNMTGNSSYNLGGVAGSNYGTISFSYNTGDITAHSNLGGIAGNNCGSAIIKTSYNTGSVFGYSENIGGIVGYNGSTIESSYNTGEVFSGAYCAGGIAGYNYYGNIQNSYNSGEIKAFNNVGGIAGLTCYGSIENTYNTGNVVFTYGSPYGGSIGNNYDSSTTLLNNFYNKTIFSGPGVGCGSSTGVTGIYEGSSVGQLGNYSTFTNWNFASGWNGNGYNVGGIWTMGTVYPNGGSSGITAPILVPDLASAVVSGAGSSTYNGVKANALYTTTYNMGGSSIPTGITITDSSAVGPNVGSYSVTPIISGTMSQPTTQNSVVSITAASGTWTITPKTLTFTGSILNPTKTYDGTNLQTLNQYNSSAFLSGFVDGQTATYIGATGTFSTSNANSTIPISVSLNTANYSTTGSGFSWSNYLVPSMTISGFGTIKPEVVTATATNDSISYGSSIPVLSGTLSTSGPIIDLQDLSENWVTNATSLSKAGNYYIEPTNFAYNNGSLSSDFIINNATSNSTALTITQVNNILPSQIVKTNTVSQISTTNSGYIPFAETSSVYITQPSINFSSGPTQAIETGVNGGAYLVQSSLTGSTSLPATLSTAQSGTTSYGTNSNGAANINSSSLYDKNKK